MTSSAKRKLRFEDTGMQIQIEEREKAKVALREALAAAGGNTKDKIVCSDSKDKAANIFNSLECQ